MNTKLKNRLFNTFIVTVMLVIIALIYFLMEEVEKDRRAETSSYGYTYVVMATKSYPEMTEYARQYMEDGEISRGEYQSFKRRFSSIVVPYRYRNDSTILKQELSELINK